jgi:hypothetical protein
MVLAPNEWGVSQGRMRLSGLVLIEKSREPRIYTSEPEAQMESVRLFG